MIMFLIVQFFGLLLATSVYSINVPISAYTQAVQPVSSVQVIVFYIIGIILFAALILFILRKYHSGRFMILMETIAIFGGSFITFLFIVGSLTGSVEQIIFQNTLSLQMSIDYLLAAIFAVTLIVLKNKRQNLRNVASIIASIGIGLYIGVYLTFTTVLIFMAILAVYDYIAVFITKHMVAMGNAAIQMNLALIVGASDAGAFPHSYFTKAQIKSFEKHKPLLERYKSVFNKIDRKRLIPVIAPRALGNGDMAVPLMVAVGAYKAYLNFTGSLVVVAGATFGLALTFMILSKYKRALPAIPPLFLGILLALGVYTIIMAL